MTQDYVITVCTLACAIGLIPQVIRGYKTKRAEVSKATSAVSSAALYAMGACYGTLGLWLSCVTVAVAGALWTILLIQSRWYKS